MKLRHILESDFYLLQAKVADIEKRLDVHEFQNAHILDEMQRIERATNSINYHSEVPL